LGWHCIWQLSNNGQIGVWLTVKEGGLVAGNRLPQKEKGRSAVWRFSLVKDFNESSFEDPKQSN
jgi:hypothetical protein